VGVWVRVVGVELEDQKGAGEVKKGVGTGWCVRTRLFRVGEGLRGSPRHSGRGKRKSRKTSSEEKGSESPGGKREEPGRCGGCAQL